MDTILSVKNLTIKYDTDLAVSDVSFDVYKKDYCCIIGSNGSGKSTLLKALLGLISQTKGSIEYQDGLKETTAYLPQLTSIEKNFTATAEEIVITGTQSSKKFTFFYNRIERDAAHDAMKMLKICDIGKRQFNSLSGGQKQRVLLARALCRKPNLLILDEPCAGLDRDITEEFYSILEKLNREKGIAILMVSHDLEQVEKYARSIVELDTSLIYSGNIQEWRGLRTAHMQGAARAVN